MPLVERRPRLDRLGTERLAWLLAVGCFVVHVTLALRRHAELLTSGYDLGIFTQSVQAWSTGRWPSSLLKGPDYPLLGDHFSPVMVLLAPAYRLFPTPVTLLVAQATLFAVAVVPLARWAGDTLGRGAAVVVGLGFGLSWELAQAVGFDVHEIAFAVPLLAFSAVALGQDRLVAAVAWAAPLVLVKEDLGLTVAAVGLLVAWRGRRRLGLLTALGGLAATALQVLVLIPAVNESGANAYTGQVTRGGGVLDHVLAAPDTKLVTVLLLLAPTAFVALRSPLVLLAVPTLAWRFASDNSVYWGVPAHYNAVLAPVLFAALVHGLHPLRAAARRRALVVSALVGAVLLPLNPFGTLATPALWTTDEHGRTAARLLAQVPDGAVVSASNWLVPQLVDRTRVSLFGYTPIAVSRPEYVLVDTTRVETFPTTPAQQLELLDDARRVGWTEVDGGSGIVLLRPPG